MEKSFLIKDTTKEQRIALIKEWLPPSDGFEDDAIDLMWEMYDPYIRGEMELSECNQKFSNQFYEDSDMKANPGCGMGTMRR